MSWTAWLSLSTCCPSTCCDTVEQLWDWSSPWGRARFRYLLRQLGKTSIVPFITAVRQWMKFCEAAYPDAADRYLVTVPKILAFIDHWTSKERDRDLVNPYATLQSYIGTGLTHLVFLQEAITMSLQQLQAAACSLRGKVPRAGA